MEEDEEDQEQGKKVEKEEEVVGERKGEKEATGSRKAARKEDEVRERHKNGGNGSKIFVCIGFCFVFVYSRPGSFLQITGPKGTREGRTEEGRKGSREGGRGEREGGIEGSREGGRKIIERRERGREHGEYRHV